MASKTTVSGLALAYLSVGGILLWSGVENQTIQTTLTSLSKGQAPAAGAQSDELTALLTQDSGAGNSGQNAPGVQVSGNASKNQALGKTLAAPYGWATGQDWSALNYGWGTLESGWNNTALNGSWPGGAYGIPQAHPGNKMPQAAWPSYAGGTSDAATQIRWGLAYIQATYGHPAAVPGWLGQGGYKGY